MHAIHSGVAQASTSNPRVGEKLGRPKMRVRNQIFTLGVLYAHALAIEHEARARYIEFATHMADYGNDDVAELFTRLAEFEAEHALHVAKESRGLEIPPLEPDDYAWFDCGAPLPETRAFVYRMMTPRLALQVALQAGKRAQTFFEQVRAQSRYTDVYKLAAELAREKAAHVAWIEDALARLPQPFQASELQPGDPTIEQRT